MKYEILGKGHSIDEWMDSNEPLKRFRKAVKTHLEYASEDKKERFICMSVRDLIHELLGEDELK
ncbi:hypothetical protein KA005_16995 [bacterium]|nr:hypothetical protein [bacterium]